MHKGGLWQEGRYPTMGKRGGKRELISGVSNSGSQLKIQESTHGNSPHREAKKTSSYFTRETENKG